MEIELHRVLRAIRRFWWIALSAAVVFGVLAASLAAITPKNYTASTSVIVVPTNELIGNPDTIIELMNSEAVLRPILDEFGIEGTAKEFATDNLRATSVPGTSLVRIQITDSDPQKAADIANAVAANVSSRSFDVSSGLLERNLNNLIFERDQIDTQLITVNTQIDLLAGDSAELSSEDQVKRDQLQAEQVRLLQRRSDLEGGIRSAERDIAAFVAPVTVNDVALPPEISDGVSPLVLGVVGIVLGALVGAVIMLWMELRDPTVRDDTHLRELVGSGSVTRFNTAAEQTNDNSQVGLMASRTGGIARTMNAPAVVLVSPRSTPRSTQFAEDLNAALQLKGVNVVTSIGLVENGMGVDDIAANSTAVLITERGSTRAQDVIDTVDVLGDLGVSSISSVMLA